jgi:hypothetical protein
MHESNCINGVQPKALGRAELAGRNQFMVAARTRRNASRLRSSARSSFPERWLE